MFVRKKISKELIPDVLLIDVNFLLTVSLIKPEHRIRSKFCQSMSEPKIYNLIFFLNLFTFFKLFNVIIKSGRNLSNSIKKSGKPPLMYEWHGKKYIGAAHGISGILYIILHLANEFSDFSAQIDHLILPTIDFLMCCKYPSGNYQSSLESDKDKLVQFCHGSSGIEFMFNLAYKVNL